MSKSKIWFLIFRNSPYLDQPESTFHRATLSRCNLRRVGTKLASNEVPAEGMASVVCKRNFRVVCRSPDRHCRRKGWPKLGSATPSAGQTCSCCFPQHLCLDGILNAVYALVECRARCTSCLYHASVGDSYGLAFSRQKTDHVEYWRPGSLPLRNRVVVCWS